MATGSTNAKSLNIMKQKIKKHNAQYETQLKNVRAKPEDSSSEEEEEKPTAPKKGGKKKAAASDSDSDSDAGSEDSEAEAERKAKEEDAKFEKMRTKHDKKKDREFDVDPEQVR